MTKSSVIHCLSMVLKRKPLPWEGSIGTSALWKRINFLQRREEKIIRNDNFLNAVPDLYKLKLPPLLILNCTVLKPIQPAEHTQRAVCAQSLITSDSATLRMDWSLPGSSVMGFSWQEYWSGLPFPPPGDLPDPGIEPLSPDFSALQVDSLPLSHQGSP